MGAVLYDDQGKVLLSRVDIVKGLTHVDMIEGLAMVKALEITLEVGLSGIEMEYDSLTTVKSFNFGKYDLAPFGNIIQAAKFTIH